MAAKKKKTAPVAAKKTAPVRDENARGDETVPGGVYMNEAGQLINSAGKAVDDAGNLEDE